MSFIGLDLGGTKLCAALLSKNGEILKQEFTLLGKKNGKEVASLMKENLLKLILYSEKIGMNVKGVGVSIPGIYYSKAGTVWIPNIPDFADYPLLKELKDAVIGKDIKINIDSDRACYMLGELWKGNAKGCQNAVFMAVGTGIGVGVLIDGKILRGSNDIAGCIGWMAINRPFKDKYMPCGCYEYYASGAGLVRYAKEIMDLKPEYIGIFKKGKELNALNLITEYDNGDEIAFEVIERAIECWGMAVANLVSLFNPEKIIFGGGVFGDAAKFIDRIYVEAKKWAQPIGITKVKIEASAIGNMAGLYGAGFLAKQC